MSSDPNDFIIVWVLKEAEYKSKGDLIIEEFLTKHPSSKTIQWCNSIYSNDFEGGKNIIIEIEKSQLPVERI